MIKITQLKKNFFLEIIQYIRQKINKRISKLGLNCKYAEDTVSVGSDTQNIKLEHNFEIKGKKPNKYLEFIITNSGKCTKEVLNKLQQVRKATWALNFGINVSVNTKQWIFYTAIETVASYGWEIWAMDYKLKKKLLRTEMSFWRKAVRTPRLLKVKKKEYSEKKWE